MKHSKSFRLIMVWLTISFLAGFWLTSREMRQPLSMAVIPEVPREGEPVVATFRFYNSTLQNSLVDFQFFVDGELLSEGSVCIEPKSAKVYSFTQKNALMMGERMSFILKVKSDGKRYERALSLPPYPPQILSSFVSFASFSTSLLSSSASVMSMTYYQSVFGSDQGLNTGFLFIVVLMILLVFLELTQPAASRKTMVLGRLRIRFSTLTLILFIIFLGTVYTKIIMILVN